jgi:hypothetical protein
MAKVFAAAAERNRHPILEALRTRLPTTGRVLEVASGSGQHAAFMARHLPQLEWCPTDITDTALASIEAHREEANLPNLAPPRRLDASSQHWPAGEFAAVVCINMVHIAPWETCLGLLRGSATTLRAGAPLALYGPMILPDSPTAPSNLEFDRNLRLRDPRWGVRKLADIEQAATERGFALDEVIPCPANNHIVVFRRTTSPLES